MNKITLTIKRLEYGRSEATLSCGGDIWEWYKKNRRKKGESKAHDILNEVNYKRVHEFMYDAQLEKFVKRYKDVVDEVVVMI